MKVNIILTLDETQQKSTRHLIRSLTLDYEKELFNLTKANNAKIKALVEAQQCDANAASSLEQNEAFMNGLIALLK
jgi:hypothetical protein